MIKCCNCSKAGGLDDIGGYHHECKVWSEFSRTPVYYKYCKCGCSFDSEHQYQNHIEDCNLALENQEKNKTQEKLDKILSLLAKQKFRSRIKRA